jgi:hypothetical protein
MTVHISTLHLFLREILYELIHFFDERAISLPVGPPLICRENIERLHILHLFLLEILYELIHFFEKRAISLPVGPQLICRENMERLHIRAHQ